MPIRLVAADLDGTLVRSDRTVSVAVREAVGACRAAGIPVVAMTARRWAAAAVIVREAGLGPLAAVAGGTAVRVVEGGDIVDVRVLTGDAVAAATAAVQRAGLQPMLGLDGGELSLCGPARGDGAAAGRYLARAPHRRVDLSALAAASGVSRILAMGDENAVRGAAAGCAGTGARLVVQRCIVQPDPPAPACWWELHVAAADKGSALLVICARLGIDPADTLALGDSLGDIPMLEAAGHAVVMANAEPGVHRPDWRAVAGVDDDGAAAVLAAVARP